MKVGRWAAHARATHLELKQPVAEQPVVVWCGEGQCQLEHALESGLWRWMLLLPFLHAQLSRGEVHGP